MPLPPGLPPGKYCDVSCHALSTCCMLSSSSLAFHLFAANLVYHGIGPNVTGEAPVVLHDLDAMMTNWYFSASSVFFRVCWNCRPEYQLIFYRRLTPMPCTFSIYSTMFYTWASANNDLGTDFNLYSSWEDLQAGVNAWPTCTFDFATIGFPLTCAPAGVTQSVSGAYDQWNSLTQGSAPPVVTPPRNVAFYILSSPQYAVTGRCE